MNKKRGLGRGLQALLPGTAGERDGRLREINIEDVVPNPKQPRQHVNEEKLSELAESIRENGVVQPIVVRPRESGKYEIIAGERRWRACKIINIQKIPALIREYDDFEAAAVALIENIQRENLSPLEEARVYKILMDDFDLTQEDVSKRVGKSRPFVGNMVRLLSLPEEIQKMLMENRLTTGHARAILGLQDKKRQMEAAKKIINKQMNVRQAETMVRNMAETKEGVKKRSRTEEYRTLEKDINAILPARVKLRDRKDGGVRVVIDFEKTDQMVGFLKEIKEGRVRAAP